MTETQQTRITCAFLALYDAAKAVVVQGAISRAAHACMLDALEAAVYEVEITCAATAIEHATGLEEDKTSA